MRQKHLPVRVRHSMCVLSSITVLNYLCRLSYDCSVIPLHCCIACNNMLYESMLLQGWMYFPEQPDKSASPNSLGIQHTVHTSLSALWQERWQIGLNHDYNMAFSILTLSLSVFSTIKVFRNESRFVCYPIVASCGAPKQWKLLHHNDHHQVMLCLLCGTPHLHQHV